MGKNVAIHTEPPASNREYTFQPLYQTCKVLRFWKLCFGVQVANMWVMQSEKEQKEKKQVIAART